MAILTSGQLTFVDITDQRKLSAYLTSNRTTVQIYNSENSTYNPDWTQSNLIITPQIFLDQEAVALTDSNLSVTWKRKDGNGTETVLSMGESVSSGSEDMSKHSLVIVENKLGQTSSDMITYICYVSYYDIETKQTVNISTQLSYTLIRAAQNARTCSIAGAQVFKYDKDQKLTSADQITLTGSTQGVSIKEWQYYNVSSSTYVTYPTTSDNANVTSSTLNVKPSHEIFDSAGIAKIKLTTKDSSNNLVGDVYDIITIAKVYDGATGGTGNDGAPAYTVLLTNESYTFPGTTDAAQADSVETTVLVYQGTVAKSFTIKSVDGKTSTSGNTDVTGLSYSVSGSTITFISATTLTEKSGTVPIIIAVGSGESEIEFTKVFSWSVARTGSGACSLSIEASSQIFKSTDGTNYSPDSITLTPIVQNLTLNNVSWKYSTNGGASWTDITRTTSSTSDVYYNSTTQVLTIPKGFTGYTAVVTSIVFRCTNGTFSDSVTVARLSDGQSASAAYTVILSNETQTIATNTNLVPLSAITYSCTVTVYKGSDQLVATTGAVGDGKFKVVLPANPSGLSLSQTTAGTVTFTTNTSTAIETSGSIVLSIQIESTDNTIPKSISFAAAKAGNSGSSAVVFRIYAPNGTVFVNQSGTLTLSTNAYYGSTQITSGATYKWEKVGSTGTIGTESSLSVDGSDVANIVTYRCTMTYNGKDYVDVITLEDKSDPYISEMLTVGGTTFKNGQGGSFVYVKVRTNGREVDPLLGSLSTVSLQASDGVSGQYYYYLNTQSGNIVLYKHNGSVWNVSSDAQTLSYSWHLMDKDGNDQNFNSGISTKAGKIIYLSCDDIDSIGTLQCDVSNI